MLRLLDCQTNEVASRMGREAAVDYIADIWVAAVESGEDVKVQETLAEEGYTCGGTADEVIGQYYGQ